MTGLRSAGILAVLGVSLLAIPASAQDGGELSYGAVVRGPRSVHSLALVFTGDEFGDGLTDIRKTLAEFEIPASFFFTGRFYRNPTFDKGITALVGEGHYLGAHSDQHLLYAAWEDRDSLLVTKESFQKDVLDNYAELARYGIELDDAQFFLPAFEWYNDQIAAWTHDLGLTLINYTPGTRSHADYTTPDLEYYASSEDILKSILACEEREPDGLNGFILLSHVGSAPQRTDKFYRLLPLLAETLQNRGYRFVRIDDLLRQHDD